MTVRPRPPHGQHPGAAFAQAAQRLRRQRVTSLRDQLHRAARGRRLVGDHDAARLADAWAAELDGAA